ncbi:hypothetical protein JTB14_005120 [Gonioctena quinquepunctata]|nr:hypothetical protein JTB14_005120 [Gonioctena quinquepunctata]
MGESNTVQCSLAVGDMPVNFTWTLNEKPLTDVVGVNIATFGKKTSVISIDSVSDFHAGNYTCAARNRAGSSSFTAALAVKGTILDALLIMFCFSPVAPRITPFYFEDNPLHSGEYAQVNCLVSAGDLPLYVTWKLNGERIDTFPEISISTVGKRSSILTIESVSHSNAGNYSCHVNNSAGESVFSAELLVNGLHIYIT